MAVWTDGDGQVSGGWVSPGWCFSATGWKSAKDRHESAGEIDFDEDVMQGLGETLRIAEVSGRLR